MDELNEDIKRNQQDMNQLNDLINATPTETLLANPEAASNHLFAEVDRCKAIALMLGTVKEA
ncbi:hypothetical protein [Limosilactobacillus pontis]|uniref:Uncharacterized protein n=1 Tax=Limosilactobacillus pontis TaxID=35787 RepID=A0ABU7SVB5_9LACO